MNQIQIHLFFPPIVEWYTIYSQRKKMNVDFWFEKTMYIIYLIQMKKKLWSFSSDAEDIYRVGTEVHNSRCPTLKCPYSGASWVVVYIDELWRDIV